MVPRPGKASCRRAFTILEKFRQVGGERVDCVRPKASDLIQTVRYGLVNGDIALTEEQSCTEDS
jgi:hypothetical protein